MTIFSLPSSFVHECTISLLFSICKWNKKLKSDLPAPTVADLNDATSVYYDRRNGNAWYKGLRFQLQKALQDYLTCEEDKGHDQVQEPAVANCSIMTASEIPIQLLWHLQYLLAVSVDCHISMKV
jgi:hypothetical protein